MRIEIDGNELVAALKNARRGSSKHPILNHTLLEAEGNTLRIQTTDLEAYFVTELDAKVVEPGRLCANTELLTAAARPGAFKLHHKGDDAFLIANPHGGSRLRVAIMPADDFPAIREDAWQPLPIDASVLGTSMAMVEYAAGVNNFRAYLNCVAVMPGFIGASDGHRGAIREIEYTGPSALLPIKQVRDVLRLLADASAQVTYIGKDADAARMLRIKSGANTLSVALIDGKFPDLRSIFPLSTDDFVASFTFDREQLLESARRFMPFSTTKGSQKLADPGMFIAVAEGAAKLQDFDRVNEENCSWALGTHEGDGEIALSSQYLVDVLDAIKSAKVRISPWGGRGQLPSAIIAPVSDGQTAQHIVVGVTP